MPNSIDNRLIHELIDEALGPDATERDRLAAWIGVRLSWGLGELERLPRDMAFEKAREIGKRYKK